jgi:hypothetical protein
MSVFLDSSFFIALVNVRDSKHERATEIFGEIADGSLGSVYTSDYIFDEAVTFALARTGRPDIGLKMGRLILGQRSPHFAAVVRVDDAAFAESWRLFDRHAAKGLSFTDCTSLTLMKSLRVDRMVSFDSGFDGLVARVD